MTTALEVKNLSVTFEKRFVLYNIDFSIPTGKLVAVVGPNGAGKTTLLKASLGLIKPTSGNIYYFQQTLKESRKRIAYIPQRESVDWDFPITLFDLVLMGRYGRLGIFKRPSRNDKNDVRGCLEKLGLDSLSSRQIGQLSGGEQQRAFVARALMQEADLYLMDEPFNSIDAQSTNNIISILKELKEEEKTLLVVHHDLSSIANIFDWVVLLNKSLIGYGSVESTFNHELLKKTYGSQVITCL